MLFLAHGAFYEHEPRAKYYDEFMKKKNETLWNQPELPKEEVDKLFKFIRRWDYHFRGTKELFKKAYSVNFEEINHLKDNDFYSVDLMERNTHICIQNIMNAFATINEANRYESTDASKIAHAILPNLFVMWDRKIREGIMGDPNLFYAENYAMKFLPTMKRELYDLIESCNCADLSDEETIKTIENICGGKTVTKLIDQYNYMTYTMPTEYKLYIDEIKKNTPKEIWDQNLLDSTEFWKEQYKYTDQWKIEKVIEMLNLLQKEKIITPKQRREYWMTWKGGSEDEQEWVFKELEELLKRNNLG